MDILNLGYTYDKYVWVFPEYIYYKSNRTHTQATTKAFMENRGFDLVDFKKIPNKGLKISVDFMKGPYVHTHWNWGYLMTGSKGLGIIIENEVYEINIETGNLLKLLQTQGVEDGCLNGTYKISESGSKGKYRLVPENTNEDIVKTQITDIYWSKKTRFTTKLIPGHLYIGKNKNLILCVDSRLNYYSEYILDGSYSYFPGIRYYTKTPRKINLVLNITSPDTLNDIKNCGISSVQEIVSDKSKPIRRPKICSCSYAGKDLGPFLKDDGRTFIEYMKDASYEYRDYHFIEKLFLVNSKIKQKVIEFLRSSEGIGLRRIDPAKYDLIRSELGI